MDQFWVVKNTLNYDLLIMVSVDFCIFCFKLQKDSFIDENIYMKQFVCVFFWGKEFLTTTSSSLCQTFMIITTMTISTIFSVLLRNSDRNGWQQRYTRKYLLFHFWPPRPACQVKIKCSSSCWRVLNRVLWAKTLLRLQFEMMDSCFCCWGRCAEPERRREG